MKAITVVLLLLIDSLAFAQDTVEKKIHYFFSVNSGLLANTKAKSITYSANTVHGVTFGERLRVGAGVGFDTYQNWQTMPLYGQVSYDIFGKRNPVFLQLGYGWSHAWMQQQQWLSPTTECGGRFFNSMIGYRLSVGNVKLYAATGYKFQSVTTRYDFQVDQPMPTAYGFSQRTEMIFERLVFTIGVGWK